MTGFSSKRTGGSFLARCLGYGLAVVVGLLAGLWPAAVRGGPIPQVAPYRNYLVTSDTAGSHTTTPGTPAFGVDHDGVADVIISIPGPNGGTFRGTGSLLPDGRSIVHAAHLIHDQADVFQSGTSVTATWTLSGGPVSASSSTFAIHPSYNPTNSTEGYDIAVTTFGSPINPAVPRYDVYTGSKDVQVGLQSVKAGYGRSGHGSTGDTLASGTKRAGLNSHDADARAVLSTLGGGSNPFGGSLPPAGNTSAYDFDSGAAANDAMAAVLGGGFAHLGFLADEVNAAPGDSGGPTFLQANDTELTLSSGASLGTFIVNGVPTQTLTVTRTGHNATDYDQLYSGDATNSDATASFAALLPEHKITGITSYGFGFTGLPDANPGTNSSWGEISVDGRLAHADNLSFLAPYLPSANSDTQSAFLAIADATPGSKSATLTIDNLATTSEVAGTGSSDPNDSATFTATVLDHSEGSFAGTADQDGLTIDFGQVGRGLAVADIPFDLFNLEVTPSFTAGLDLDAIIGSGDTGTLTTDLATFSNLAAGGSNSYLASFDSSALGVFSATYQLNVSDQNLPGATSGTSLLLTLQGEVLSGGIIPEPATLGLLLLGAAGATLRRRRRRSAA